MLRPTLNVCEVNMDITEFEDKYFFLSNFYETPVLYRGYLFNNNEAAFQAMKCPEKAEYFVGLTPLQAKHLGRQVKLRADWEFVKEAIMYEICKQKFLQHPSLAKKLMATGNALLVEGNDWGDQEWGVCDGQGENKLGKILMTIRKEFNELSDSEICVCCGASLGDAELGTQVCSKCKEVTNDKSESKNAIDFWERNYELRTVNAK